MNSRKNMKKLKKNNNVEEEDRISGDLNDDCIFRILSMVDDTRTIVQSSLLMSKRWKDFWICSPSLSFTNPLVGLQDKKTAGFVNFVEKVLELRNEQAIVQNFHLSSEYKCDSNHVVSWISYAVMHGVEDLCVCVKSPSCCSQDCAKQSKLWRCCVQSELVKLPECLFTCQTIKVLQLISSIYLFSLPTTLFSLGQLQHLHLERISSMNGDWVSTALTNCPILDTLVLRYCKFHGEGLQISSRNLKKLTLICLKIFGRIKICAPKLTWLELVSLQSFTNNYNGDWLSKALASCLLLQTLVIRNCYTYKLEELRISSQYLKQLELSCLNRYVTAFDGNIDVPGNIDAPNLTSLTLIDGPSSGFGFINYSLGNIKYLVKGEIGIKACQYGLQDEYYTRIMKLLNYLSNVKDLTILEPNSIQAITKTKLPRFSNLRCLKLHVWSYGPSVIPLSNLLKSAPYIETLIMVKETTSTWELGCYELEGLLDNLKTLEMKNFKATKEELIFLKTVLRNAPVLENARFAVADKSIGDEEKAIKKTAFTKLQRAFPNILFKFIHPNTSLEYDKFHLRE